MNNKEIEVGITYLKQLDALNVKRFNFEDFGEIVDMLGAANYKADARLIAVKDPAELARVADSSYLTEELGIKDAAVRQKLVKKAVVKMEKVTRKYRAVLYYIIRDLHEASKK